MGNKLLYLKYILSSKNSLIKILILEIKDIKKIIFLKLKNIKLFLIYKINVLIKLFSLFIILNYLYIYICFYYLVI